MGCWVCNKETIKIPIDNSVFSFYRKLGLKYCNDHWMYLDIFKELEKLDIYFDIGVQFMKSLHMIVHTKTHKDEESILMALNLEHPDIKWRIKNKIEIEIGTYWVLNTYETGVIRTMC